LILAGMDLCPDAAYVAVISKALSLSLSSSNFFWEKACQNPMSIALWKL
jgi:hypothetical protein